MGKEMIKQIVTSNFGLRFISAIILVPIVLFICYLGGFYYNMFIISIAVLMAFEWENITKNNININTKIFWKYFWKIFGVGYIVLPTASLIYIRTIEQGYEIIVWMFVIIWCTDIFAYLGGRFFKGPKLIPFISPNKTWSGLFSGVTAGTLAGLIIVNTFNGNAEDFLIITFIISIYSQIGDLLESFIKRQFNTKDSGSVIPGHGGVLDRVDGIVLVAPKVALLSVFYPNLF